MGAMADRTYSASIQRVGCSAIQNLSCNEDNEVAICSAGGVGAIVAAMDKYPGNVRLQHKACAALRNLAASNNDNRTKIRKGKGIKALCGALKRHPDEAPVQEVACSALGNLCLQNEKNRSAIARADGINLVIAALTNQSDQRGVQEKGCRVLHNLALNEDNLDTIREAEVESLLWEAANKYPKECGDWTEKLLNKL